MLAERFGGGFLILHEAIARQVLLESGRVRCAPLLGGCS